MQKIASTITADPIIAAIATHKRLERKWLAVARKRDEGGASGPSESDVELASEESLAAAWAMAETEPTTAAGAAAMLRYLTRDPLYGVWEAFEFGKAVWLETAFDSLQRGLARLARESRQAEAA